MLGEDIMVGVISQHLLSTELQSVETQLARLRTPAAESEALLRVEIGQAQAQTMADCKHLEVTLQATRCEHTAADAALQTALEVADELLREAATRLFVAQDELARVEGGGAALERVRRAQLATSSSQPPPPLGLASRQPQPPLDLPPAAPRSEAVAATPATSMRSAPAAAAAAAAAVAHSDSALPTAAAPPAEGLHSDGLGTGASEPPLGSDAAAIRAAAMLMKSPSLGGAGLGSGLGLCPGGSGSCDGGGGGGDGAGGGGVASSAPAVAHGAAHENGGANGHAAEAYCALPGPPPELGRTQSRAFANALAAAIEATSEDVVSAAEAHALAPPPAQPPLQPLPQQARGGGGWAGGGATGHLASRRPDLSEYVRQSLHVDNGLGSLAPCHDGPSTVASGAAHAAAEAPGYGGYGGAFPALHGEVESEHAPPPGPPGPRLLGAAAGAMAPPPPRPPRGASGAGGGYGGGYGGGRGGGGGGAVGRSGGGAPKANLRRSSSFTSSKCTNRPPTAPPTTPRSPEYRPSSEYRPPSGSRPPRPRFVGLAQAPAPAQPTTPRYAPHHAPPAAAAPQSSTFQPPQPPHFHQLPPPHAVAAYGGGYSGGYGGGSEVRTPSAVPAHHGYATPHLTPHHCTPATGGRCSNAPTTALMPAADALTTFAHGGLNGSGAHGASDALHGYDPRSSFERHEAEAASSAASLPGVSAAMPPAPSPHLVFRPTPDGLKLVR